VRCYTYLFAMSVLKVGGRLHTPRLITAKPMLLLGLVPTPISVRPILQYRIISETVLMHITVCWDVTLWQGAAPKAWKNVGMAPHTINLSTRWEWLVSSTHQSLHSQRKSPTSTHWRRGWVGPRASVNGMKKRKSRAPARNLSTIPWLSSLHPSHCT
jgi:hypothetical protein